MPTRISNQIGRTADGDSRGHFDLDGVITDTAHLHFLAWKALGDSLGVEITLELNEGLKGLGRQETLTLILKEAGLYDKYTEAERQLG